MVEIRLLNHGEVEVHAKFNTKFYFDSAVVLNVIDVRLFHCPANPTLLELFKL